MQIEYVNKEEDFRKVREAVLSSSVVGWDTETTGFDPKVEKMRTMQFSVNPEKAYVCDMSVFNDPSTWKFFCDVLADPAKVVIAQNGKFDLKFFTEFMGQGSLAVESFYDTMITSQLIGRGNPELRHGLDGIARRELGVYLDKTLQKSDFSGPLSDEQVQYAGRDAAILLRIREAQLLQVQRYGLERVTRLESDAVAAIADLELNGFYLDEEAWTARTDEQTTIANNLREQLLFAFEPFAMQVDLFGAPVLNIDSPPQVLPFLKALGVPIHSSTSEDELRPHMRMPIVKTFLDYREVHTALIKFGPKYCNFIHPVTGRIHADFRQIKAPSGRMSCGNPNLQQITRGAAYREAFKARNGGKLIIADYSQIELRIMAVKSRDPNLVQVYREGRDVHNQTAHLVFHVPYDTPPKEKRDVSKNLNFGATYGVGEEGFAQAAGIPIAEAAVALRAFWSAYKVLGLYMDGQGRQCADTGLAYTWSGRTLSIIPPDPMDRRAYGSAKRLGRNFGIQGTGADILKRAVYLVRNRGIHNKLDIRQVNLVHDEIVVETNDDPEVVKTHVEEAMKEAGQEVLQDIPCEVGIQIGDTWKK